MYLKRVFMSSELPADAGHWFVTQERFVRDGFTAHTVGEFVTEAAASPGDYNRRDVAMCRKLDRFFTAAGAAAGEEVLVEHG